VARAWGPIAVAMVAATLVVSGCAASHYQQVSCSAMSRQSIFLLEARAVPSATLIPSSCPTGRLELRRLPGPIRAGPILA
jgi:hypothetical protein